jgi:D-threo-aldose 1-dehydrogenase
MHSDLFAPCLDGMPLGLGGAPLGNLFAPVSDAQARALLDTAWADGCRSFDTAPHYGHGLSEHRMGDGLRAHARTAFRLSSKAGRLLRPDAQAPRTQHGYVDTLPFVQHWDFSASGIRRSVEDSLQRLGLAQLDTVFLHDIDAATHGALAPQVLRQVLGEALPTLAALKSEGLIRGCGLGVNDHAIVLDVLRHADLDAVLLAGRYTLLDTVAAPECLPQLQARGVAVALGGVFNSGILAQRLAPDAQVTFNYASAPAALLTRALAIQAVCDHHGVALPAAALQFALAHPATTLVLLGPRDAAQWQQCRTHARAPIPAALWDELRHSRLIPEGVSTP